MRIYKPIFWETKNIFSYLLLPISIFLQILAKINNKITVQKLFRIPVICIGNIYLGGTGKTPLVIFLTKELIKNKKNPAIIKKFYPQHIDEHGLIKNSLSCLILDKNRHKAINMAQKKKFDVAIMDDGFQDYSIKKNLNILCFNGNQLIGNGFTIPSGPLRESMNGIKRAHIVIVNGNKNKIFEKKILSISNKIKVFYSNYFLTNTNALKGKKIFAFAGIGNPSNFFELIIKNKLNLQKKIAFPDHYAYSKLEIQKLVDESKKNNFELVTTEKDYHRIKKYGFKNIRYVKIELKIIEKENFIKQIMNYL